MRITERLLYFLLYGISLMPMSVLYGLSNLLAYVAFSGIGYRKEIVLSNLSIAFPEKSEKERVSIAKEFYLNFCDAIMESIKLISADNRLIDKLFVADPAMLKAFEGTTKNIQIHAMHNFSWEIVNLGVAREMTLPFLGVYQPITNKFFNELFKKIRSRNGTVLIPANDFKNNFLPHNDKQYVLALVADQNPGNPAKAWWVNFFGKAAPFVMGPENAARQRDTAVLFANFYKVKRGLYSFSVEKFTDNPADLAPGELTQRYIKYIEDKTRERPANYLWSHRRWKHQYKPEYANQVLGKLNM
jgi:KDO2-lipid IV(A) lauroyltransferase